MIHELIIIKERNNSKERKKRIWIGERWKGFLLSYENDSNFKGGDN